VDTFSNWQSASLSIYERLNLAELLILFMAGMCIAPIFGGILGMFVGLADEMDDWSTKRRAKRKKKRAKSNDDGWMVIFRG